MKLNRKQLRKIILKEMKNLRFINAINSAGAGLRSQQKGPRAFGAGQDYSDGVTVTNGVFSYEGFSIDIHYAWVQYNQALYQDEFVQGFNLSGVPEGIYWIMANIIKDPVAIEKGFAASRAYPAARELQDAIIRYNNYIAADGITTVNRLKNEI